MAELRLSPRAASDLDEIADYTAATWSPEQAETYILALREAMESLARNPAMGPGIDQIRSGYRRYITGSHAIFYRVIGSSIWIVRILHTRMDADAHLLRQAGTTRKNPRRSS